MRLTFPLLAGLTLGIVAPLAAAPRPDDKPGGPALVGQSRSWNDLIAMLKEGVKAVGGEKLSAEFEKSGFSSVSPDIAPGINPAKPFAVYGLADADIHKCRLVIMVPVKDEPQLLKQLEAMHLTPEKPDADGVAAVGAGPGFPLPIHLKFHAGYAYFSLGGADALAAKSILAPKDVLNEKDKSPAVLTLKFDRMPPELKKFLVANLGELIDQGKEGIQDAETKEVVSILQSLGLRWLRQLADQGKELTLRLDGDPKTADLKLDIAVEALPKTALAAAIARREPSKNAFAGLVTKDAVQWMLLSAPLFHEDVQDALVKLLALGEKAAVAQVARGAPPEAVTLTETAFKSLRATLKTGEMDLGLVLRGPNKDGHYTAVGAVHCQETADLEKAIKTALAVAPDEAKKMVKLDAGKVGDLNLHEIHIPDAPEELQKFFGKDQTVYIGVGKTAIYAAYGPDAKKALADSTALKPAPAAAFDSSGNTKRTAGLMKKLPLFGNELGDDDHGPGGSMKAMLNAMEKNDRTAGTTLAVTGGDKLHITLGYSVQFGSFGGPTSWMMFGMRAGGGVMKGPVRIQAK